MGDRDDRRDDDRRTVSRFQSGEREEALRVLFERYGPVTYAFFRRRVGAPDVAVEQPTWDFGQTPPTDDPILDKALASIAEKKAA